MTVICISTNDNRGFLGFVTRITINNKYEVLDIHDDRDSNCDYYQIINDVGKYQWVCSVNFITLNDYRNIKIDEII